MSFAQVLERLRDAAQEWPKDDTCVVPRGDRRIVERNDLREILKHFDRIDGELRRIAAEESAAADSAEAKRRQSVKDYHDLLLTLEIRGEICKRLFDTLPKASEYEYSERYGTHVYTLTIKRQPARKEDGHGG